MMSGDRHYRASKRYIWRLSETLGTGAFGSVYRGYHKETGEAVAIKTLNSRMLSPVHLKQHTAELEILKTLNHPNIVKLVGIEQEIRSTKSNLASQVIIMELGTEGSLYSIIEQPENNFGIPDSELLLILKHLSAGLHYLRQEHKVIHRDVKPSNILKSITPDGEVLYKLCDFGAARVLAEEDSFHSLVGTPEYLHPDIYGPALLTGAPNPHFSASCDLWSIGVTLYQIITGQLPFRPYGGSRGSKQVMYEMIRMKESGVISGYQEEKNGEIKWSKKFPAHCSVSSGLRPGLIHLLAKLLESTEKWSYNQFFKEVQDISSKQPVHCLSMVDGTFHTCYGPKSLTELRAFLANQLFPPHPELRYLNWDKLVLIWNGEIMESDAVPTSVSFQNPILVFVKEAATLGTVSVPPIPFPVSVEERLREEKDCEWAKQICNLSFWIERKVTDYAAARNTSTAAVSQLRQTLAKKLSSLESVVRLWKQSWTFIQHQMAPLSNCRLTSSQSREILYRKEGNADNISKNLAMAESELITAKSALLSLEDAPTFTANRSIGFPPPEGGLQDDFSILSKGKACCLEVYEQFRKDKAMKIGSDPEGNANDINWHGLMKRRAQSQWKELEACLRGKEFSRLSITLKFAVLEVQKMLKLHERLEKLERSLGEVEGMIKAFDESMHQVAMHHVENDHDNKAVSLPAPCIAHNSLNGEVQEASFQNKVLEIVQCTQDMRQLSQANVFLFQKRVAEIADQP